MSPCGATAMPPLPRRPSRACARSPEAPLAAKPRWQLRRELLVEQRHGLGDGVGFDAGGGAAEEGGGLEEALHVGRAQVLQRAQAVEPFRKAAELQPMNPHAFYELAMAHHALGHVEQVAKIIRRVSEFDQKVTRQLVRETGQLPEGVVLR